jgi:hypothetical protein
MTRGRAPKGGATKRWQVAENVTAAVEAIAGHGHKWRILQNVRIARRDGGKRRQVDVVAECPSGPHTFRVAFDVKDEKSPLDIVTMEQLCKKASTLEIDRYVVVSTSGFTAEALEEARRCGVRSIHMERREFLELFGSGPMWYGKGDLHRVDLVFDSEVVMPEDFAVENTWLEFADRCVRVDLAMEERASDSMYRSTEHFTGELALLRVHNREGYLKSVIVAGKKLPPPTEFRVEFSAVTQDVARQRFALPDGQQVMAGLLPLPGGDAQVTMVGKAAADGSRSIKMTVSRARPEPVDL